MKALRRRYHASGDNTDYSQEYFTLKANTAGSITWGTGGTSPAGVTLDYSINEGSWTSITSASPAAEINVSAGDKVRFKGSGCGTASTTYSTFGGTAEVEAYGNTMSLLHGDSFATSLTVSSYCFLELFNRYTNLVKADNLILPARSLYTSCYEGMFEYTSITKAPELPATSLGQQCYAYMFNNCTSLITGPSDLPATSAGRKCYYYMFQKCTSLQTAPASINLSSGMSSTGHNCEGMFRNCWVLTTSPVINMPTLERYSCEEMFYGCERLNYVTCLATTVKSSSCDDWLSGVSSTGTFVKAASMTSWSSGVDGIPTNWTVVDWTS